jgi:hypothetical protein
MKKNLTPILLIFTFFFSSNCLLATVYTTSANGNFSSTSTWNANGVPPSPLVAGDVINIDHVVTLTAEYKLKVGTMNINASGEVNGNKKLKVESGGSLVNDGTINITEQLKVSGTGSSITNNGSITVDKLHVGDNAGDGFLTNNAAGVIVVNGELHLDNILNNIGTMTVSGIFKNHGGTLKGGGMMTNCLIEFEKNGTRKGTCLDQDLCCDFDNSTEATFQAKGGVAENSLVDFVDNNGGLEGTHHSIDGNDFLSCGDSYLGPLPVELIDFRAKEDQQQNVVLFWATASESNNMHFVIERAADGRSFEALETVNGNGTTDVEQNYFYTDTKPILFAYYRLKQVDYDGSFEYSNVIFWEMKKTQNDRVVAFPTLAENEINLRFTTFGTKKSVLTIVSSFGRVMHEELVYSTDLLEYRKLDLTNYQNGIYSIILSDGFNNSIVKFVVSKTY